MLLRTRFGLLRLHWSPFPPRTFFLFSAWSTRSRSSWLTSRTLETLCSTHASSVFCVSDSVCCSSAASRSLHCYKLSRSFVRTATAVPETSLVSLNSKACSALLYSTPACVSHVFVFLFRCAWSAQDCVGFLLYGLYLFSTKACLEENPLNCDSASRHLHGGPSASYELEPNLTWIFRMSKYCPWKTDRVALQGECASDIATCDFSRCLDFAVRPTRPSQCGLSPSKSTWKSSLSPHYLLRSDGTWDRFYFGSKFGKGRRRQPVSSLLCEFRFWLASVSPFRFRQLLAS